MTDVERLFRTYHDHLVRYLTRRLGDRDWAEEVAQETFVRALRQGELQNERAWLFAVATNLVRDEARKDARRRRHLELLREEAKAESVVERVSGRILVHCHQCRHATALLEHFAHAVAGSLGRYHADVDVRRRNYLPEPDIESVREHQGLARTEVRLDVIAVEARLTGVGS